MSKSSKNTKTASNIINLTTNIHVAIFNGVLLDEIRTDKGRWFNVRTKDHHLPFLDCEAQVTPEGAAPGVQFEARKLNYNFNDSNWVGNDEAKVVDRVNASLKAAGIDKVLAKKEVYWYLQDIKDILKASTFKPAPAPAPEAQPAS